MDELSKANGSKSNCALFSGIAGDAMQRVVPRSNWCSSEDYLIHQPPPKDGFTSCHVLESGVRGNPPAPFGRGERLRSPTYPYNVRTYRGKLLIKPSKESVQTLLGKIRNILKENKQATAGDLIVQLNPIIRGWALYHRHVVSKETFSTVDHAIFGMLWQWAKRRHPNKGRRWVKAKYFQADARRQWVFSGEVEGKKGDTLSVHLTQAAKTTIRRHPLIRGEANPYDPVWEAYFDERMGLKWQQSWLKRRKLIALWREQEGKCPVCDQKITKESGWHVHHILQRVYGGTDHLSNLLLLHPNCHRQVHHHKLSVTKPGIDQCLGEA